LWFTAQSAGKLGRLDPPMKEVAAVSGGPRGRDQKAPGEWDHPAADPGIAGFGEPLFPPLGAALVRRTRQAGGNVK
jgi:hypothetical protein